MVFNDLDIEMDNKSIDSDIELLKKFDIEIKNNSVDLDISYLKISK